MTIEQRQKINVILDTMQDTKNLLYELEEYIEKGDIDEIKVFISQIKHARSKIFSAQNELIELRKPLGDK